jgi:hypothetical protein
MNCEACFISETHNKKQGAKRLAFLPL